MTEYGTETVKDCWIDPNNLTLNNLLGNGNFRHETQCFFLFQLEITILLFTGNYGVLWSGVLQKANKKTATVAINKIKSISVFRWFTLKPLYTITSGNLLSAIWDTSH